MLTTASPPPATRPASEYLSKLEWLSALGGLLLLLLVAVGVGAYGLSWSELQAVLFSPQRTVGTPEHFVFWHLRLPRVVFAMLIGAGLAASGATVQTVFRNPLADPSLIGVSSGCMLFAVFYILLYNTLGGVTDGWAYRLGLAAASFVGGLLTTAVVYGLAAYRQPTTSVAILLLAGVAITALCGGGVGLALYWADDQQLRDITFWNLGSLSGGNWNIVALVGTLTMLGIAQLMREARALEILQLGDREAQYLGVATELLKRKSIVWVCVMVGSGVAFTGSIGFVGLMVPHLVRLGRPQLAFRKLLLWSTVLGSALLLLSDTIARTLVSPSELPIGILMAFLGGPFFLWLLYKNKTFYA